MRNNVIPFSGARQSREELREQACAWLARLDTGASEEDMAQLAAWAAEDPRHARMLLNMAAMWDHALVLSELAEIFPLEEKKSPLRRRLMLTAAAALAAIAVLGGTWLGQRAVNIWEVAETLDQRFETAVGERRRVDLPDGSEIVLNTNTRLQVYFNARERRIVLERGESYFNVVEDADRPFRVFAGSRVVEAVGTAFTVQHTPEKEIEVLVTEGKVNFLELAVSAAEGMPGEAPSEPLVESVTAVVAGERVTVIQAEQPVEKVQLAPVEVEMKLAWRVGMLVFQGDPLETVLQEVSRYTTIKLQADESIRGIPVDGVYPAGDIEALLVAMERNFQIGARRISEDEILLSPRGGED